VAKQPKTDTAAADSMASALFSSFTQPAIIPGAVSSRAEPEPVTSAPDLPHPVRHVSEVTSAPAKSTAPAVATAAIPRPDPSEGGARSSGTGVPRRNRAAPEAKRRRETVILSEAERRPIVAVAEHMAATKPGSSFSEAARFLLAVGEHVLATRPDAYAQLERTPPSGWAALARALAASPAPK